MAAAIYEILLKFMTKFLHSGQIKRIEEREILQEYMLLLILAVSHPAFTIEMKEQLRTLFEQVRSDFHQHKPARLEER